MQAVVLDGAQMEHLEFFVEHIAPRHGHHVKHFVGLFDPRSAEPNGDSEEDDEREEQLTLEQAATAKNALTLVATAMPFLTRVVDVRFDIGEGRIPFDLAPSDDPLRVVTSKFGHQLEAVSLTRLGVGEPAVSPGYVGEVLRNCPNVTSLELTAVAAGESAEELEEFHATLRGLSKLQQLNFLYSDAVTVQLADKPWQAPIADLSITCCNNLLHRDFSTIFAPFRDTLTTLRLTHIGRFDDDIIPPAPPLPAIDLPNLTSLALEANFPVTFLATFASSPIANLMLQSSDDPCVDPLAEHPDDLIRLLNLFVREKGGLRTVLWNPLSWDFDIGEVSEWCVEKGVRVVELKLEEEAEEVELEELSEGWETASEREEGSS